MHKEIYDGNLDDSVLKVQCALTYCSFTCVDYNSYGLNFVCMYHFLYRKQCICMFVSIKTGAGNDMNELVMNVVSIYF